ncbi:Molybdopterin molybdenumtransferase [Bosea sp. 62]|uniref:molybdopterin molybdotransferase MoeA n=1 Tax=unclassified Bosea (in: a-proteobacteria) TaxID=2653178 RepID=UPI00125C27C5|nr:MULTISPECIES: gephyrin-like molybdotransferase Glp [unclassified Bosea (in: a-proteobacteria)]CAD5259712.1 Molybdopterin molybdenumtransferase [Bosea sp. 46]CAD5264135.1 Molybdopterin molybdenumtransferase [Bosea sp. 21B]CAD5276157.1 Molybdopterin molybdenumtransferase [Bosea sp. 7B]VVT59073.1 Molybdopterin molybdotransferase [Bosea sp. EC-HK365B]VXB68035.1 Molybdopterin molybdenumtransferase [Bosea sp. 29B]
MSLTPVPVALKALLDSVPGPTKAETLPLAHCAGRVLAGDVAALRTQPPFANSAMDGYAARAADLEPGKELKVIGESAAGRGFPSPVGPGETVRIFTGAPIPDGADAILIQEHAEGVGSPVIRVTSPANKGQFIRPAGLDFETGEILLKAGRRLDSAALGLAAAAGHPTLSVRRKPLVAILATGDELVLPGEPVGPDQIVASNSFALAALIEQAGGTALDLGIARDNHPDLANKIDAARKASADVLITLGGASVGEHDLVQAALKAQGMELGFWKIAMRPGKPMMMGRLGPMVALGLPGNPVSSIVCGHLFAMPLVEALLGIAEPERDRSEAAILAVDLPANDERQDYLRATVETIDGERRVRPFAKQDSSMLANLSRAEALVIRPAFAEAAKAGDPCRIIRLR